jgi:HEPN domain-containing protein
MSGVEHAHRLLAMAQKDLKSLANMLSPEQHDDEIFGFHAQQAIEKSLKAWIAQRRERYPLTHDLSVLLGQLQDGGEEVSAYWSLVEFTVFGVQYRYDQSPTDDDALDRHQILSAINGLLTHVAAVLSPPPQRPD